MQISTIYISVQIQFHIIDKFTKFSPDITTVLPLLTKALGILSDNLFRIYERFPKNKWPLFLYYINIFIYLSKIETIKNYKDYCLYWMQVVRRLVDHCPIKFSRDFPLFLTRVLPCFIILKQEFYQILVRLQSFEKLLYFILNS